MILSFGFALVFVDIAKMIWGRDVHGLAAPSWLAGSVAIGT